MARHHGVEPKKQSNGLTILANMLLGSILTCIIGLFIYLWSPIHKKEEKKTETPVIVPKNQDEKPSFEFHDLLPRQEIQALPDSATFSKDPAKPTTPPKEVVTVQEPTTQATESVTTEKPTNQSNQKVIDNTSTHEPKTQTKQVAIEEVVPKSSYVIRMSTFYDEADAEELLGRVRDLGIKAKIITHQHNGMPTYQVISQRISHQESVEQAQLKLQQHGIDSLITEEKLKE